MMSSMHAKALILAMAGVSATTLASIAPETLQQTLPVGRREVPVQLQPGRHPIPPAPAYDPAAARTATALARWSVLRQSDSLPFATYASFLASYPGWPGESGLRRTAERAIEPGSTPSSEVIAFFRALPPLTTAGQARYAFALLAEGQIETARSEAREAWAGGVLPKADEEKLLAYFGAALSPRDHDRRMEMLLDNGDTTSASRTLPYASAARRAVYDARLALQTRAPDASTKVALLGSAVQGEAGLLVDRANWLRNTSQSVAARSLLAQPRAISVRPADAEQYYEGLLAIARGAAADDQWTYAYQIASQIDDAFEPGTDVSTRSAGERDDYTSLAWLAGTAALHNLGRPADAMGMFERYAKAARSFQTRSKGFYWAGRAATAAGQPERATAFFEQAAHPDLFYGQLALERLGRHVPAPAPLPAVVPGDAAAMAFERRDLVAAIKLLGQQGRWEDQSLFVRTLSEQLTTEEDRMLAGLLALRIGRPDLGVWIGRNARNAGTAFYTHASFPQIKVPPSQYRYTALSNAITRQESSFDRAAVSPVGARGMMQLMPGTAREVSGKLGLPYEAARLTRDPDYNILLGSTYFASLMDQWGGSAPLAVASYNAGAGNVRKWIRANGDPRTPGVDMLKWIEDIPFSETRNYVQRVLENAVVYDMLTTPAAPPRNRLSYYLGKGNQVG